MQIVGSKAFLAVALMASENRSGVAQTPAPASASAQTASPVAAPDETCWRRLLGAEPNIEQRVEADLDGDGVPEVVVLSSTVDPDLLKTEGVTQDTIRSNPDLRVRVFQGRDGGCVAIEGPELTGRVVPLVVSALKGGGKRKYVVASALHCGASCAGIELHVATVQAGRIVKLLDLDSVDKGEVTVTPAGELAVREAVYRKGRITARRLTRYVVQGDVLTVASRSDEPAR